MEHGLSSLLLVELPLGGLSHKQISSLVGLAPISRDSSKLRGKRTIWGGRACLRAALYMSTLAAAPYNLVIKAFDKRLRGNGKPAKVALVNTASPQQQWNPARYNLTLSY